MTIEIMNIKYNKPVEPWDVKVDRSSVLGNPFYMKSESQREEVCKKYEEWLLGKMNNKMDSDVFFEMVRLFELYEKHGKLRLFCWCAPKQCHAESIKRILIETKERRANKGK